MLQTLTIPAFTTLSGVSLGPFPLSYEHFGKPLFEAPLILVNHALTANSTLTGEQGWWNEIVGSGKAVNTAKATSGATLSALREVYQDAYGDESFIHLLPEGQFPTTASVANTNNASLGIALDEHSGRVVIVSAIDNLVKGTAGGAIQSLNLALGFDEGLGLDKGELKK
jgi:hypothetical protein